MKKILMLCVLPVFGLAGCMVVPVHDRPHVVFASPPVHVVPHAVVVRPHVVGRYGYQRGPQRHDH